MGNSTAQKKTPADGGCRLIPKVVSSTSHGTGHPPQRGANNKPNANKRAGRAGVGDERSDRGEGSCWHGDHLRKGRLGLSTDFRNFSARVKGTGRLRGEVTRHSGIPHSHPYWHAAGAVRLLPTRKSCRAPRNFLHHCPVGWGREESRAGVPSAWWPCVVDRQP